MVHIPVLGLDILPHDQVQAMKSAASAAGHTIVDAGEDGLSALWQEVRQKYPALVSAIQNGIHDIEDSTLSGGQKAVKVATDVLPLVPTVLNELKDLKSFVVHGVTLEYAVLKNAAGKALADIAAKL